MAPAVIHGKLGVSPRLAAPLLPRRPRPALARAAQVVPPQTHQITFANVTLPFAAAYLACVSPFLLVTPDHGPAPLATILQRFRPNSTHSPTSRPRPTPLATLATTTTTTTTPTTVASTLAHLDSLARDLHPKLRDQITYLTQRLRMDHLRPGDPLSHLSSAWDAVSTRVTTATAPAISEAARLTQAKVRDAADVVTNTLTPANLIATATVTRDLAMTVVAALTLLSAKTLANIVLTWTTSLWVTLQMGVANATRVGHLVGMWATQAPALTQAGLQELATVWEWKNVAVGSVLPAGANAARVARVAAEQTVETVEKMVPEVWGAVSGWFPSSEVTLRLALTVGAGTVGLIAMGLLLRKLADLDAEVTEGETTGAVRVREAIADYRGLNRSAANFGRNEPLVLASTTTVATNTNTTNTNTKTTATTSAPRPPPSAPRSVPMPPTLTLPVPPTVRPRVTFTPPASKVFSTFPESGRRSSLVTAPSPSLTTTEVPVVCAPPPSKEYRVYPESGRRPASVASTATTPRRRVVRPRVGPMTAADVISDVALTAIACVLLPVVKMDLPIFQAPRVRTPLDPLTVVLTLQWAQQQVDARRSMNKYDPLAYYPRREM